jgi:two-component system copper resistance phosphate regulon response regulator CusR
VIAGAPFGNEVVQMEATANILVVEDDQRIAELIQKGLEGDGYQVAFALDGESALKQVQNAGFDLVILDLGLPGMDGFTVLERLRNRQASPPVLILSARGGLDDRVKGLELGADDYIAKPFAFVELLARIRAILRRGQPFSERLQVGDLVLDCLRRKVFRGAHLVDLAPKEFSVLECLMRHRGKPLSRAMIVERVWEYEYDGLTNIVDVYIRHLRSKIDDRHPVKLIHTVRGVGYMVDLPDKVGRRRY